jgi:hypothetical protein
VDLAFGNAADMYLDIRQGGEFDVKPIEFESLLATIRRVAGNPK